MTISELSKLSGISSHTLRYYEKIGLLKNINRNTSGYREYNESDVSWLEFLKRLKATGMPIKDMLIFAELRYKGDSTIKSRLKILETHKIRVENDINELKDNLYKIIKKIEIYKEK